MLTISEFEICREYRLAKNKREMVEILSDLTLMSRQAIRDILIRNGFEVKQPSRKNQEQSKLILEMYEAGVQTADIAKMFGWSVSGMGTRLERAFLEYGAEIKGKKKGYR